MRGRSKQTKVKRLQVPKACTNCRRMHTGCDVERPCRRCVQHGLEDECVDLARRKRIIKRKIDDTSDDEGAWEDEEEVCRPSVRKHIIHHPEVKEEKAEVKKAEPKLKTKPVSEPVTVVDEKPKEVEPHTEKDLVDVEPKSSPLPVSPKCLDPSDILNPFDFSLNMLSPNDSLWNLDECFKLDEPIVKYEPLDTKSKDEFKWDLSSVPYNNWNAMKSMASQSQKEFSTDQFILTDFTNVSNEDPAFATNLNPLSLLPPPIRAKDDVTSATLNTLINSNNPVLPQQQQLTNVSNRELNFLIQQIAELKESNKTLEHKLLEVSSELVEAKHKKAAPLRTSQPQVQVPSGISMHAFDAPATAVSSWRISNDGFILSECNDKFINLMGYPLSTLKSRFSTADLHLTISLDVDPHNWPKRTKIATARGISDVYVTVNGVQGNNEAFIMQLTEAR